MKRINHQNKITICYLAGREALYSRTAVIKKGLENAGFRVIGIFPPDKRFRHYPALLMRFLSHKRQCDLIVVGFYGQLLMICIRLLTRKPILYDLYISTYDTLVYDRRKAGSKSVKGWIYWAVDRLTMLWADRIILETKDHIQNYAQKFRVPAEKFEQIFLAVDEKMIFPMPQVQPPDTFFLVHFHGEYAPFHGVSTILKAANLLRNENVRFEIIGTGFTCQADRALANRLALNNVQFIDWIPYKQLGTSMSRAHCCLGIFGDNPRTFRVLTNKVIEALAAARPLISVKNDPVQELLFDGESALLVPPADPEALAGAIRTLRDHPALARSVAQKGYQQFKKHCTLGIFSNRLGSIIRQMVAS
ncbi:glycosyltransferase [bacterium]|nr:glycosyltransferase [bacterium]